MDKKETCPACGGLGYIEYETGVEHGGVVEIANEICGCQMTKKAK